MVRYRVGSAIKEKGSAMGLTGRPKRIFIYWLYDKKQFGQSLAKASGVGDSIGDTLVRVQLFSRVLSTRPLEELCRDHYLLLDRIKSKRTQRRFLDTYFINPPKLRKNTTATNGTVCRKDILRSPTLVGRGPG